MKASNTLIEAIKRFEGFRGTAYKCPAGVWTIGYGHTVGVKHGDKMTEGEAERQLRVCFITIKENSPGKYLVDYIEV